jgi:hypothetical protein
MKWRDMVKPWAGLPLVPIGGLAAGWAILLVAATWNDHTAWGVFGSAVGGVTAILAACWLPRQPIQRRNAGWVEILRLVAVSLGAVLVAVACRWLFGRLSVFPIAVSLPLEDALVMAFGAFGLVVFLRGLTLRWPLFALVEAGVALTLGGQLLADHRSRIDQPTWLMDWFIRKGADPFLALAIAGIAAMGVWSLLLYGATNLTPTRRSFVSSVLSLGLLAGLAGSVVWLVPIPQPIPPSPLPPPMVSSDSNEPPPPPPPPKPFAWIELLDSYPSTPRLKGLYFRTAIIEDPSREAVGNHSSVPPNEVPPVVDAEKADVVPGTDRESASVVTHVHLFRGQEAAGGLPSLAGSILQIRPIPTRDRRFFSSWEVRSLMPGKGGLEDLRPDSLRTRLGDPDWTDEERARYTRLPADETGLGGAADALLAGLPSSLASQVSVRMKRVTDLSDQSFQPEGASWAFTVESEAPGTDPAELSRRAVCLLRALGIASRLVRGFRYPLSEGESKTALLLTDQHLAWWPEVFLEETGWVPLTFAPPGGAGKPPPSQHDLEQMMADSLKTDGAESTELKSVHPQWSLLFLIIAGAVLAFPLTTSLWVLVIAPVWGGPLRPARIARAVDALLTPADLQRRFGEPRSDFARRVAQIEPVLGESLEQLAASIAAARYGGEPLSIKKALGCLRVLWFHGLVGGVRAIWLGTIRGDRRLAARGGCWYFTLFNPLTLYHADRPTRLRAADTQHRRGKRNTTPL